jgi:hypothetical protein
MKHSPRARFLALAFASATAVSLNACDRANAEPAVSVTRTVDAFDRVRVEGAFTTSIVAGGARRVVVRAGHSNVARVTTRVENGTLVVDEKDGGGFHAGEIRIDIAVPDLRGFANSGAGGTRITGVHDDIDLSNDGAGSIDASGRAGNVTISLNGTGKIDTTELAAHDVTATDNGVGGIYVRGSGRLTLSVNGVGEIRYTGSPTNVESHVAGVGRIDPL